MSRLDEIREREKKASKGPWWQDDGHVFIKDDRCEGKWGLEIIGWQSCPTQYHEQGCDSDTDEDFIAHSREDIPYLLTLIAEMREALEKIKEHVPITDDYYPCEFSRHVARTVLEKLKGERE